LILFASTISIMSFSESLDSSKYYEGNAKVSGCIIYRDGQFYEIKKPWLGLEAGSYSDGKHVYWYKSFIKFDISSIKFDVKYATLSIQGYDIKGDGNETIVILQYTDDVGDSVDPSDWNLPVRMSLGPIADYNINYKYKHYVLNVTEPIIDALSRGEKSITLCFNHTDYDLDSNFKKWCFTVNSFKPKLYVRGEAYQKRVIIEFDDGYRNQFEKARPILNEKGLVAVFNIITNAIGSGVYMTAEQLRILAYEGHEIASHGANHVSLDRLSKEELQTIIHGSMQFLKENRLDGISFGVGPFGSGYNNQTVIEEIKNAGYTNFGSVKPGIYTQLHTSRFAIPRYDMNHQVTLDEFKNIVEQACDDVIVVLGYHTIENSAIGVLEEEFERQMNYLVTHGFKAIRLRDIIFLDEEEIEYNEALKQQGLPNVRTLLGDAVLYRLNFSETQKKFKFFAKSATSIENFQINCSGWRAPTAIEANSTQIEYTYDPKTRLVVFNLTFEKPFEVKKISIYWGNYIPPLPVKTVLSITSNFTVTGTTFISDNKTLKFALAGPNGATGFVEILMDKNIINDISGLTIYANNKKIDYTVIDKGDVWDIYFKFNN